VQVATSSLHSGLI